MNPKFQKDDVRTLYKYLPMTDGSLATIKSGTMKFSSPLDFNDPFDCKPFYPDNYIDDLFKERPHLLQSVYDETAISPAGKIKKKNQFLNRVRSDQNTGRLTERLAKTIGVVCLTEDPLNTLMWSHYADNHKGFVLEFGIPVKGPYSSTTLISERLICMPVEYKKERPVMAHTETSLQNEAKKAILTKSEDWRYEKEWRHVDLDRGPGIYDYNRDEILCSVIAGFSIEKEDFKRLLDLVNSLRKESIPHLMIQRIENIKGTYKLKICD